MEPSGRHGTHQRNDPGGRSANPGARNVRFHGPEGNWLGEWIPGIQDPMNHPGEWLNLVES